MADKDSSEKHNLHEMYVEDLIKNMKFGEGYEFPDHHEYLSNLMTKSVDPKIYEKMLSIMGDSDKAKSWFYTKHKIFDYKRPYDLCVNSQEKSVYEELLKIEQGTLA